MEQVLKCPSGLTGRIRGLKGREFRLLSDRRGMASGEAMSEILSGCWLETIDPAVYAVADTAGFDWSRAWLGDRFRALIAIRQASYPPPDHLYCFDAHCRERSCRAKIPWQLDLADLEVREIKPHVAEQLRAGRNEFSARLGAHEVRFKLLSGKDQERQRRLAQQPQGRGRTGSREEQSILLSLASRIVGVEGRDVSTGPKMMAFLDDLEISEHRDLIEAMEEVDFGVETQIEVECGQCGLVQEIELPFDREFFLPRTSSRPS